MKALTVRQPHADEIAFGEKRTENRTRPTRYRGPLLIHAGLAPDRETMRIARMVGHRPGPDVRGAVIAVANLSGCHHAEGGCCPDFGFPDCWHWELADVRALPVPVPAKGQLGLWTPPPEVLATVEAQYERMKVTW